MKKITCAIILFVNIFFASAQKINNTSYTTQTGERVLRLELVVPIDKAKTWELFTKDEELKKWIAPVVHIHLQTGGYILTNYDSTKSLSDSSSIRLGIINYIEGEMLSLKVTLNDHFPASARAEDKNLQEIIQLKDAGNGNTKIISSMVGWGNGADWDKTYNFFLAGNTWTYKEIAKLFNYSN